MSDAGARPELEPRAGVHRYGQAGTAGAERRHHAGRTFDALVHYDARSLAYPARDVLPAAGHRRSYSWRCRVTLDQGREGACVGNGCAHDAAARPAEQLGVTEELALRLYHRAQQLDEWPGEAYDGSSVLAGAKAMVELGAWTGYRWAGVGATSVLDDVLDTLAWRGPVVLGITWRAGMYDPAGDELEVTGDVVGRHCILANAVDVHRRRARLHNSWGPSWGQAGEAWLSWDALDALLHDQGEACVPVGRRVVRL